MVNVSPVFAKFNTFSAALNITPSAANTGLYTQNNQLNLRFPWLKDPALNFALQVLEDISFNPKDVEYINSLGVNLPFSSGSDAVKFLEKSNVRIAFDDTGDADVHAQYDFERNLVKINKKYQNTDTHAEILAISEAILHEAGHVKDSDGQSSIQEELACLAMNALAHRIFLKKYPDIFNNSSSPIINDGVSVYSRLFFDSDPGKKALIERMRNKYGYLPAGDAKHLACALAHKVKQSIN